METIVCNNCGSADSKYLLSANDLNRASEPSFNIVRCTKCGLSFVNPRPTKDEIGDFYPTWYHQRDPKIPLEETTIWGLPFNKAMAVKTQFIRKFGKKGRVLDIGCGDGCVLHYLRQQGWDTQGVEFGSVDYGTQVLGLDIFQGRVEDAPFENESFDVVSLFHVLEHLPDPRQSLSHMYGLIKKGGHLVIEVPNFGGLDARIFGKHWVGISAPLHLYHYTAKSLTTMVESCGFRIAKYGFLGDRSRLMAGYSESLRFALAAKGLYPKPWQQHANSNDTSADIAHEHGKIKKPVLKGLAQTLEYLIFRSVSEAATMLGMGTYLYLVARKPE